jgi:hypothetical protein
MRLSIFFVCALGATTLACTREMSPARAPAKETPQVEEAPVEAPPPGSTRVILDADGERAHADEVMGVAHAYGGTSGAYAYNASVLTRPLCSTLPCALDLANGEHQVVFVSDVQDARANGRIDMVNVRLTGAPKVVRRAIGHTEHPLAGQIGGGLAGLGLLSAVFCWIPFVVAAASHDQDTKDSWNGAGRGMAIGGGLAVAAGIVLMVAAPDEHTPGTTTEWTLPAERAPASIPVRSAGLSSHW